MPQKYAEPFCQEGAEPDRYSIFAMLREMWVAADPGPKNGDVKNYSPRNYGALADYLEVPKQNVTQWATGTGGRAPAPWFYIMRLCKEFGLGISITPEKCTIYKVQPEPESTEKKKGKR